MFYFSNFAIFPQKINDLKTFKIFAVKKSKNYTENLIFNNYEAEKQPINHTIFFTQSHNLREFN